MSIYKKLNEARKKFHSKTIKKTGRTNRSEYFKLDDFLPHALKCFDEVGLCGVINFTSDKATLSIHETEGDGVITFESPMSTADLPKCHAVQNLGGVQTFLRRYLWGFAVELIEEDEVEKIENSETVNDNYAQNAYEKQLLPKMQDAAMKGSKALQEAFEKIEASKFKSAFWVKHGESLKRCAGEVDNATN